MAVEKVITAGQKSQLGKMLGDAAGRLKLSSGDVQMFLNDGARTDPFKDMLEELLKKTIPVTASPTPSTPVNRYAGETTRLAYFYPCGWKAAKLGEQYERLRAAFPGLKLPDPVWDGAVPPGFDGPAYHIFPERLGLHYDIPDGNGEGYGWVIENVVLPALEGVYAKNGYGFFNYRARELGPNYIRLEKRGRVLLEQRQAATDMDAFIGPVSLGQFWKPNTLSPRNACETAILCGTMLPLGSVQAGCHLVAMPDRLTAYDHLWLDCPGDQYNWGAEGFWSYCPYFDFGSGWLGFLARVAGGADGRYGPAVAFLGRS